MKDPLLGLRGRAEEVQLVLGNGATRPVIGTSHPEPDQQDALEQRLRIARHWGTPAAPRRQEEGGLTEAMDLRQRTILSHDLPADAQRLLQEGRDGHGKVPESGVLATVRLKPR